MSEANQFKARVALEALKGSQIPQDEGIHPVQVSTWKKELQERLPEVFGSKSDAKAEAAQTERAQARLERKVGQFVIEKEFLEKNAWSSGSIGTKSHDREESSRAQGPSPVRPAGGESQLIGDAPEARRRR